jgi:hypothetical protein
MLNGLYRVHFQTPLGMGAGVIYAADGRLRGGDAAISYIGNYSVEGDALTAKVVTDRHSSIGGIGTVFGKDKVTIDLTGKVDGARVLAKGSSPDAPGISFSAELVRISD